MSRTRMIKRLMEIQHPFFTEEIRDIVFKTSSNTDFKNEVSLELVDTVWHAHSAELWISVNTPRGIATEKFLLINKTGQLTQQGKTVLQVKLVKALSDLLDMQGMETGALVDLYDKIATTYDYKKAEERRTQGLENDAGAHFNDPKATADMTYWLAKDEWSVEEAATLSFGKDPRYVTVASLKPFNPVVPSNFRPAYGERLDLIARAVRAGKLSVPICAAAFFEWAYEKKLCLPPELPKGLEAQHDAAQAELVRERDEALAEVVRLKELIRCDNIDVDKTKRPSTLYQMLLGMAIARFGYKTNGNNGAAKLIDGLLRDLGLSVGDDTVRGTLRDALNYINERRETEFEWTEAIKLPSSSTSIKPKSE